MGPSKTDRKPGKPRPWSSQCSQISSRAVRTFFRTLRLWLCRKQLSSNTATEIMKRKRRLSLRMPWFSNVPSFGWFFAFDNVQHSCGRSCSTQVIVAHFRQLNIRFACLLLTANFAFCKRNGTVLLLRSFRGHLHRQSNKQSATLRHMRSDLYTRDDSYVKL